MPTTRKSSNNPARVKAIYRGKQTRTGNSSGFRFEGALFRSHPEFTGAVTAQVIAPGRMLVTAEAEAMTQEDPVLASFLAFLGREMERAPQSLRPFDTDLAQRMKQVATGVEVSSDEDLGEDCLL